MKYNIRKVAVLGSGIMGAGIAAHFAGAGIPVLLLDMPAKELTEKEAQKGLTLDSPAVRNRVADEAKKNITSPKARAIYDKRFGDLMETGNFDDHMHKLSECDWVIEVIVENMKIKKGMMEKIAANVKPGTIVTTNTSGLSIEEIVSEMPLEFRQKFLGSHFFNPPRYMKLFEMIPVKDTEPELIEFIKEFAENRLGKGVVLAKDTPGFIANRIGSYSLVRTLQLTEQYGYKISKVDQLTGPIIYRPKSATFKTLDMVGIDIVKHVTENTNAALADPAEKAVYVVPDYVNKMVENKWLGNKTKQGFYKKDKKDRFMLDYKTMEYVALESEKIEILDQVKRSKTALADLIKSGTEEGTFVWELLRDTLLYCAKLVPEISDDFQSIDEGMIWGYNWTLGPFEIWDAIGLETSVDKMKSEGLDVPEWVTSHIAKGNKTFYASPRRSTKSIQLTDGFKVIAENPGAILMDIGEEVLALTFKTKGNTITGDVIGMINQAADILETDYKGMVIAGMGPNFSLGANLGEIKAFIDAGDWEKLSETVGEFQNAGMRLKYAPKPVVAAVHGMVLGGGAEIALHTDKILAHAETYMGLVEAGVGLLPGGGGNKEMLLRSIEKSGSSKPREYMPQLKKSWETIAMAKVSSSAFDAMNLGFLRSTDEVIMNADALLQSAKDEVLSMYQKGYRLPIKKAIKAFGLDGKGVIQYTTLFMKEGLFISPYDAYIGDAIATVMTGGEVPVDTTVSEAHVLLKEREMFVHLCQQEKTQQRIAHMLTTNKPLRN